MQVARDQYECSVKVEQALVEEEEQREEVKEAIDKADEFANTPSGARYGSDKQ